MLLLQRILLLSCVFPILSFSQTNMMLRENIKEYFQEWISQTNDNWAFEIDGVQFSTQGLDYGLKAISSNIASLSKPEQEQLKNAYTQTFIDQTTILMNYYKELLDHKDLDLLIQEFFRQAATQLWLEKELEKDPKAIEPAKEEIEIFFKENSEILLKRGLSASQIFEYSKQQLQQKKLQEWTQSKVKELRDRASI
ncbi:MAG: hypothetical protein ACRCTJ_06515, partial [Brevinema sp.]